MNIPIPDSGDTSVFLCANKLAFDTKAQAEGSATTSEWRHGGKLKVYLCKNCALWHLATRFTE